MLKVYSSLKYLNQNKWEYKWELAVVSKEKEKMDRFWFYGIKLIVYCWYDNKWNKIKKNK